MVKKGGTSVIERKIEKFVISGGNEQQKEILERLGIKCKIFECDALPDISDKELENEMKIQEIAHFRGRTAAKELINRSNYDFVIISVETAAIFNNKILKIPKTKKQIKSMLKNLSGKTHKVVSGLCVWWGNKGVTIMDETFVTLRRISEDEINQYAEAGDYSYPGGYNPKGAGGRFIEKIEGSWFNLMGMPVNKIYEALEEEYLFKIFEHISCGLWETGND